ncbi:MAG: hypothetical protein WCR97_05810 [Bacilli bacterium]
MKNKNPNMYYIVGGIVLTISVAIMAIGITVPMVMTEPSYIGWIGVAIVAVGVILFFYGIYLLKKGNFIKINKELLKQKEEQEKQAKIIDEMIENKKKENNKKD